MLTSDNISLTTIRYSRYQNSLVTKIATEIRIQNHKHRSPFRDMNEGLEPIIPTHETTCRLVANLAENYKPKFKATKFAEEEKSQTKTLSKKLQTTHY